VFGGTLDGLYIVEVEFTSEDEATAFVAPQWFGREVTGDPAWTNASLARHGRPAT
jgi:adenylate cyclase